MQNPNCSIERLSDSPQMSTPTAEAEACALLIDWYQVERRVPPTWMPVASSGLVRDEQLGRRCCSPSSTFFVCCASRPTVIQLVCISLPACLPACLHPQHNHEHNHSISSTISVVVQRVRVVSADLLIDSRASRSFEFTLSTARSEGVGHRTYSQMTDDSETSELVGLHAGMMLILLNNEYLIIISCTSNVRPRQARGAAC